MAMDTKQTILAVITVAAFGYLGYQIYGLIKSDVDSSAPMMPSRPTAAMPYREQASMPVANPAESQTASVKNNTPQLVSLNHQALAGDQKAYLHMVNQYELAKMKHRLLEEQAAIAAAEHRIATLKKQTHEINESLSTSPELDNETTVGANESNANHLNYQLTYVDRQNGQWSATLTKSGRYYEVHIGTILTDGYKVIDINHQGVLLQSATQKQHITFEGVEGTSITSPKVNDFEAHARQSITANSILSSKVPTQQKKANIIKQQNTLPLSAKTPEKKEHDIVLAQTKTVPTVNHKASSTPPPNHIATLY